MNKAQSNMKYYQNKHGYLLCTELSVDIQKTKGVKVINSLSEAEHAFRQLNSMDVTEGVFIPSIIEENGQLFGQGLNACFAPVDESLEDYISEYLL